MAVRSARAQAAPCSAAIAVGVYFGADSIKAKVSANPTARIALPTPCRCSRTGESYPFLPSMQMIFPAMRGR